MAALSLDKQKELYHHIEEIFDLTNGILNAVKSTPTDEHANLAIKLTKPLIKELNDCAETISINYIDYLKNDMNAKKSQVKASEGAMRKVFTHATKFIDSLKNIPTEDINISIKEMEKLASEKPHNNQLLPVIGYKLGQLIPGPIRESLTEQMVRLPELKGLIKSVRKAVGHIFKLTYCFLGFKKGLVQNPNNVIWGRTVPDIKAQAIFEKNKIEAERLALLNSESQSHIDSIHRDKNGRSIE